MTLELPPGLAPGIYFDLPGYRYHVDRALGSGDVKLLYKSPRRYWLSSVLNPDKRSRERFRIETDAMTAGSGMHAITLEGIEKFKERFVRRPDDPPGSSRSDKAMVTRRAKDRLMTHQDLLSCKDFDLCIETAELIEAHPDLAGTLNGGARELSVIWERPDGVFCKARFDLCKEGGIADLKALANEFDLPLERAATIAIKRRRLDIQAEHYLEARRQFPALISNDAVFSWSQGEIERTSTSTLDKADGQLALAAACAAESTFSFLFIFIQKNFPSVWATLMTSGNPALRKAREGIENAIESYKANLAKFGVTERWADTWRLAEFSLDNTPGGTLE